MSTNIRFDYLYRDGGNYKSWGAVIFENPDRISINDINKRLRKAFDSQELFIAKQIRIPEVFPDINEPTRDDHCFHEFDSIAQTAKTPNDVEGRSINDFIEEVEAESKSGWKVFAR